MKPIEELLQNLARTEVIEFGLVTNRLPSVNIAGKFQPVDDEAPTTDAVLQMLVQVGGSRHVETLSEKPVQWTMRLDGVGVIAVAAIMRKDVVQARFTVARRDATRRSHVPPVPSVRSGAPPPPPHWPHATGPGTVPRLEAVGPKPPRNAASAEGREEEDNEPTVQTHLGIFRPGQALPAPPVEKARAVPPPEARPRASAMRRLLTPTNVDVESLAPAPAPAPAPEESGADAKDDTLKLQTPAGGVPAAPDAPPPRPTRGSGPLPSGVPSTEPSAAKLPKEHPRLDAGLESFLALAVAARASDLHLVGGRPVLLRVASDLVPRTAPVPIEVVERLAREIVPPRLRGVLERDGACHFTMELSSVGRFRVQVSKHRGGHRVGVRVLRREGTSLDALGLPDPLGIFTRFQRGLVLVVAPASHGKTTTLAALVEILAKTTASHIVTIEDPIELACASKRSIVNQREVGTHVSSLAAGIETAASQDADAIVVSELTDATTVRAALRATQNGHLVLSTICAPNAAKGIERLLELLSAEEQEDLRASIAASLRMIVGQRLVPSADRTQLHAAVEMFTGTVALATLVREGRLADIPALQRRARGVIRFDDSLAELVRRQKITLEAAKQVGERPTEVEALSMRPATSRRA